MCLGHECHKSEAVPFLGYQEADDVLMSHSLAISTVILAKVVSAKILHGRIMMFLFVIS